MGRGSLGQKCQVCLPQMWWEGGRSASARGALGRLGFMEKGFIGVAAVEFLKARLIS